MCFICILLGRFKIDLNVYLVGEPRSDQTNKYFHVSYLIENNEHILGMVAWAIDATVVYWDRAKLR